MAMSATAIRFDEGEKDWIQSYASVLGMSFSEFVRSAALEKVEEAADIKAYNEALVEDDGTRYSMDDVMRMAMEAERASVSSGPRPRPSNFSRFRKSSGSSSCPGSKNILMDAKTHVSHRTENSFSVPTPVGAGESESTVSWGGSRMGRPSSR